MSVLTIGYERYGQPDFIARLQREGVAMLIDVRAVANSRKAGYSKKMLAASLNEACIAYRHMVALGTPKAGREAARAGDMDTLRASLDTSLAEPAAALDLSEIAALSKAGTICLMCLEEEWTKCHRSMICERLLADHGVAARHLRMDG